MARKTTPKIRASAPAEEPVLQLSLFQNAYVCPFCCAFLALEVAGGGLKLPTSCKTCGQPITPPAAKPEREETA